MSDVGMVTAEDGDDLRLLVRDDAALVSQRPPNWRTGAGALRRGSLSILSSIGERLTRDVLLERRPACTGSTP